MNCGKYVNGSGLPMETHRDNTSNHGSKKYLISTGTYTEFVDDSAYWTTSKHETLPNCVWIFTLSQYETVIQYENIRSESNKERNYSLRLVK